MMQRQDTLWLMWSAVASPTALRPMGTAGMCAPSKQQRSCGTGCLGVQGMLITSEDCKIVGQLPVPDAQGARLGSSAWLGVNFKFFICKTRMIFSRCVALGRLNTSLVKILFQTGVHFRHFSAVSCSFLV